MSGSSTTGARTANTAWPRVRLGDVIAPRNDIVHPRDKPFGRDVFVGLQHVESGTGHRLGSEEIDKATLTGRKARFLAGDIVYGYLRPYLNKVWLADFDGLCSVDQYVYIVDQRQADAAYIGWFMRSPLFLSRAPVDSGPGQLPRIRLDEIARVELDLPPLPEQKRIAATLRERLDAAARMRAAADCQDAHLERLRRAVVESQLSAADSWPTQAIGQLASVVSKGTTPTSLGLAYASEGVPFVRAEDVTGGALETAAIAVHIDEGTHQTLRRSQLHGGDILITIAGTLGRTGYVPTAAGQLNCNQAVAFARPHPELLDSRYGWYALQRTATLARLVEQAAGGALQNLNLAHVRNLHVPAPPLSTQRELVAGLDSGLHSHGRAVAAAARQRSASEQLPSALLRRAFSEDL